MSLPDPYTVSAPSNYLWDIYLTDPCESASVIVNPVQTDPANYAYTGTTSFLPEFNAVPATCDLVYTCESIGVPDWCSQGDFNTATGAWSFDTDDLSGCEDGLGCFGPDKASHPLGSHGIKVTGTIVGYPD